MSELLRMVESENRKGRTEMRGMVLMGSQVFGRPFHVGVVLFRGRCGGGVDRRCSGASKVKLHGHNAFFGHGQAAKKRGERSDTT